MPETEGVRRVLVTSAVRFAAPTRISGYVRILVFDASWRLVAELSDRLMADVHEALADARGIWVTATGTDMLLLVGRIERTWPFRADRALLKELGFRERSLPGGPEPGDVVGARPDYRGRRVGPAPSGRHHGSEPQRRGGRRPARVQRQQPSLPRGVRTPSFARGLARIGSSLWLVGSQAPLAVYAVHLDRREIVASYPLGGIQDETVFGICPLPDEFGEPRRPLGEDPYEFWRRAGRQPGVSPIPS